MQKSFSPNTRKEIVVINELIKIYERRRKKYTEQIERLQESDDFYRVYRIKHKEGMCKSLAECLNDLEVMKKKLLTDNE